VKNWRFLLKLLISSNYCFVQTTALLKLLLFSNYILLFDKIGHNTSFQEKRKFFAENGTNRKKFVAITSTPGTLKPDSFVEWAPGRVALCQDRPGVVTDCNQTINRHRLKSRVDPCFMLSIQMPVFNDINLPLEVNLAPRGELCPLGIMFAPLFTPGGIVFNKTNANR
jgi:hypothetical protein